MRVVLLALLLLCGCVTHTPVGPPTITDPASFLTQLRCMDGGLEIAEPGCVSAPQKATDAVTMRRHDWPAPTGYAVFDAPIGVDGPETIWDYAPFGDFVAANSDGGEVYVVAGNTVRISITQDGGTPGLQGFYGARSLGTGWVAFRTDAPTGSWATMVAALKDCPVPSSICLPTSQAFTRYRLENVALPWIIGGAPQSITLPTIISEHYDKSTLAASSNMERSLFVQGVGRAVWESWSRTNVLPVQANRCPGTAWSTSPGPGWVLNDCRYGTNVVSGPADVPVYTWPPLVSSMP